MNITTVHCACPDGVIDVGEECDDNNAVISDGCTLCMIDLGYTCDGADPTTCINDHSWGDGVVDASEECDDGNNLPHDGCEVDCTVKVGWDWSSGTCLEICGDGLDFHQYACDDNNTLYEDGWAPDCSIYAGFRCGGGSAGMRDWCFEINQDGLDFGWFGCDHDNFEVCDGCNQFGEIEPGYICNDGRPDRPDICWPTCGDGLRVCPEECDDGNNIDADGCSANCIVETGFTCAGGNFWRSDYCYEICGDGHDIGYYQCDDGNLDNGDGCDDSCVPELGFNCNGGTPNNIATTVAAFGGSSPDVCIEIWADGLDFFFYPWDDGNTVAGDGCDANCNIEPGWDCQYGTNDWHDECWHWHNNPAIVYAEMENDTWLAVDFNVSVTIPTTWDDYHDLELIIEGPREEYRYYEPATYELLNKATELITPYSSSQWILNVTYDTKIQFLGDGVENLTLKVVDRDLVTHFSYGFVLINDAATGIITTPTENDRKCDMEEWWKVAYWLYIILVINNFCFFLIGASLWHTIGISMSLQMVIYFPFMHNYPPSCLTKFFKDFQIVVGKQPWLNLQKYILGLTSDDLQPVGATNYRFDRQGFVSYNMLYNSIEMLMLAALFLASVMILSACRYIWCRKEEKIMWYEHRHRWEVLVKGFVFIYMHMMICCMLNILHPVSTTQLDEIGLALSYIFFSLLVVGFLAISAMIMYYRTLGPIGKELYYFRALFNDIDVSSVSKYYFYIFYLLKRTSFAVFFTLLHDKGLIPFNLIYIFTLFLPLMYLCYALPFTHRLTNFHMIYNELNELFIITLYYYYYDPHLTDWQFYEYARITVIDIAVWVIASYIIFLLSLPRVCRCKCPERKPRLYLPEYEEEIEQILDSPISEEKDFIIPAAHVAVKEAKRNYSFSSDEKASGENEILDDDIDADLEDIEQE